MNEWPEFSLDQLCGGKGTYGMVASASAGRDHKFLRTTDMIDGKIEWSRVPSSDAARDKREKYLLHHGDIVISRTGANAGAVAFVNNPPEGSIFAGYLVRFSVDPNLADSRFVYYQLSSSNWREYVQSTRSGSAQPQFNAQKMGSFRLNVPPLREQQRIAGVLGALDDLIDTNEKLMRQLDEISIGLFLEAWDGETWCEIQDLGTITMGQSPPGSALSEDPAGIPFFQGVRDFGVRFPAERIFTTDSKRSAAAGSILIAVRAPVGQTNIALKDSSIGRGLASLEAHEPSVALRALRATAETWAAHQGTGTVFSSINGNELRKAKVPRVDNPQLAKMLKTFDEQYAALHLEVANLRRTRDELLPLLMSGKIRVREAEEDVASVTKESA